jgi:hypothetical protein
MAIDYSKLSTPDLQALKSGDLSKVSTQGLQYIKSQSQNIQPNSNQAFPVNTGDVMALQNPVTSMAKLSDMLTGSDVMGRIKNAAQGAEQGITDIGEGAYNLADRGLHALFPNSIPLHTVNTQVNPHPNHPAYYMAGEMAPTFALPEAKVAELLGKVGSVAPKAAEAYKDLKSLPYAGRAVNFAEHLINPAATGAAYGALYNAGNSNKSISSDLASGGLLGSLLGAITRTPAALASGYLRKIANNPDTERTPEQVGKILESDNKGNYQTVPISDLAGSQLSSRFYKWLAGIPGSGSYKAAINSKNAFEKQANMVRNYLLGSTGEGNIKSELAKDIQSNYNKYKNESKKLYDKAFDTAKAHNVQVIPSSILDFSDIPEVKELLSLKKSPAVLKALGSPISEKEKSKYKLINVEKAHRLRSDLLQSARQGYSNKNTTDFDSRRYLQAADAISNDMENSGTPESTKLYRESGEFYRNNVAPYFDNNTVYKAAIGKLDNPSGLSGILAKRESPQIGSVLSHLTPQQRNLAFLDQVKSTTHQPPEGTRETNAQRFWNKYSKMDEDAKQALLTPKSREKMNQLGNLSDITHEDRIRANTPRTGYALKNTVLHSPEITAMIYGLLHHPLAALPVGAAFDAGASSIARFLRSPQAKQGYVNQVVNSITPEDSLRRIIVQYLGSGRPVATINAIGKNNVNQ